MRVSSMKWKAKMGARLLDAINPAWYDKVNIQTLDMQDLNDCILGQVYGSYGEGMEATDLAGSDLEFEYGFDCKGYDKNLNKLNKAWIKEVIKRRFCRCCRS